MWPALTRCDQISGKLGFKLIVPPPPNPQKVSICSWPALALQVITGCTGQCGLFNLLFHFLCDILRPHPVCGSSWIWSEEYLFLGGMLLYCFPKMRHSLHQTLPMVWNSIWWNLLELFQHRQEIVSAPRWFSQRRTYGWQYYVPVWPWLSFIPLNIFINFKISI